MTTWTWHTLWMTLHILGAVVAFGPMYTQPMIAAMARRNARHALFAAEISASIATRYTIPGGLTLALSGYALMVTDGTSLYDNPWLWLSVLLYAAAMVFALTVQRPKVSRMLDLLRAQPSAPPGTEQGPGPKIAGLGRALARGIVFLTVLTTAVFILMIWQPGTVGHG